MQADRNLLHMEKLRAVVLDEADAMLSRGFASKV